jgi:hypothetical protein
MSKRPSAGYDTGVTDDELDAIADSANPTGEPLAKRPRPSPEDAAAGPATQPRGVVTDDEVHGRCDGMPMRREPAAAAAAAAAAESDVPPVRDGSAPAAAAAAHGSIPSTARKPAAKLDAIQQQIVDCYVANGRPSMEGQAGTGKSEVYKAISATSLAAVKRVYFMSSTGLSASNIGGVTFHSFLSLDIHKRPRGHYVSQAVKFNAEFLADKDTKVQLYEQKCAEIESKEGAAAAQAYRRTHKWYTVDDPRNVLERVVSSDGLVFDELYGLKPHLFATGILVARACCDGIRDLPTIAVAGDPMQGTMIPSDPSKFTENWQFEMAREDATWIQESPVWKSLKFKEFQLTKIYRQTNPEDQSLNSGIRMLVMSDRDMERLSRELCARDLNAVLQALEKEKLADPSFVMPVYLHYNHFHVNKWNLAEFTKLKTPEYVACPQVHIVYTDPDTSIAYSQCIYDSYEHGWHLLKVAGRVADSKESVHVPFPADLSVELRDIAVRSLKESRGDHQISGHFKVGAPLQVFVNQRTKRDPADHPVNNGTRGTITELPSGFYPKSGVAFDQGEEFKYIKLTRFQGNEDDVITQFPLTIRHPDGRTSKIGAVDRFYRRACDMHRDMWRDRRWQICIRAHPAGLCWADTADHNVGCEYDRGIVDMGSMRNRKSLFYVAFSRFSNVAKTRVVNFDQTALQAPLDRWEHCATYDERIKKLDPAVVELCVTKDKETNTVRFARTIENAQRELNKRKKK